jgi:hypothetical protein
MPRRSFAELGATAAIGARVTEAPPRGHRSDEVLMALRVLVLVAVSAGSIGCGGKILVEETDASAGTSLAAPTPAASAPRSIAEACATICERQGRCGARTDACEARCEEQAAMGCGASAWLRCYAEGIENCGMLPPACEPAYCAWAACAGRPVPDYCP